MFKIFGLELTPNEFLYGCLGISLIGIFLIAWGLYSMWKFRLDDSLPEEPD